MDSMDWGRLIAVLGLVAWYEVKLNKLAKKLDEVIDLLNAARNSTPT